MVNSDAVASVALLPGAYPQRIGRRLGSQVDLAVREGDRSGFRLRTGLSGTSATALAEGPLAQRGSWLFSARRSYMDLLLKRLDDDNSLAFGFGDGLTKVVCNATPKHQLQALGVFGGSRFDESPEELKSNDEATVRGQSWLAALSWRYPPSSRMAITQRVHATGVVSIASMSITSRSTTEGRARRDGAPTGSLMRAGAGWSSVVPTRSA